MILCWSLNLSPSARNVEFHGSIDRAEGIKSGTSRTGMASVAPHALFACEVDKRKVALLI
jgi:hypothetical protein